MRINGLCAWILWHCYCPFCSAFCLALVSARTHSTVNISTEFKPDCQRRCDRKSHTFTNTKNSSLFRIVFIAFSFIFLSLQECFLFCWSLAFYDSLMSSSLFCFALIHANDFSLFVSLTIPITNTGQIHPSLGNSHLASFFSFSVNS